MRGTAPCTTPQLPPNTSRGALEPRACACESRTGLAPLEVRSNWPNGFFLGTVCGPLLLCSLIQEPGEYLPALQKAAEDAVRRMDPKYLQQEQALRGVEASVQIAIEGPMGFNKLTPRELLSPFLNKLVCVNGIVTKCKLFA